MDIPFKPRFQRALKSGWNAFFNRDPTENYQNRGPSYSSRPDRVRFSRGTERSIITSVYNRIAIDVASIPINHCRLDENGGFLEIIKSGLNDCLTVEANIDQTGKAFIQDAVMSMLDEGVVALVPIDTDVDPDKGSFDILSMRTGKIEQWRPSEIQVQVYNEQTGQKQSIPMSKSSVAIIENPFYSVMNEPSSTMQRLVRKLNLLDAIDEQSGSGKLDLIIQLPYVIKTEARRKQAEDRRKLIEDQLSGSKYGIAYTDGTEHITQLNRAVDNNLMKQIEYLTSMLYSQLGITQSILDGTADEKTMLNYHNRTVKPVLTFMIDEMKRKFLTKTARTQRQSINYFRNPFESMSMSALVEASDSFTRNEVVSRNEFRQIIGLKPSDDPKADELRNSNVRSQSGGINNIKVEEEKEEEIQNEEV